jgi:hypothetical protein
MYLAKIKVCIRLGCALTLDPGYIRKYSGLCGLHRIAVSIKRSTTSVVLGQSPGTW